jgi:Peptidase family S41
MNRFVAQRLTLLIGVSLSLALACGVQLMSRAQNANSEGTADQHSLSVAQWREDLRYLAEQMPLKHKSLFHTMTEAEFRAAVARLDADIPKLNGDEIFVRLAQITAMVQDGHSGFDLRPLPASDQKEDIPIRFDRYEDGIYVRAAAPEYAAAVGGKMIEVGSVGWQEAMRRVDSIESHDPGNDGEQLAWSAKTELNRPRILHGLGLSDSAESGVFVIEKDGQRRSFTMKATAAMGAWYLNSLPPGWVDARPASTPVPLSRQHEDKAFWFTVLPEQHAVYFQFNLVLNLGEETLEKLTERLKTALERRDVERLVIDVRNNTGGDNTLLRSLLVALIGSKVNHRGGIYVITGPTTFSAGQNFVNRLENYADVIFVGAPTGENVNFYGDPTAITLPHSHLVAAMPRLWWQDQDPRDTRATTAPELAASGTFADYVAGKDLALDLSLAGTPPSIEQALEKAVSGGLDVTLAAYRAYVTNPVHKYLSDPEHRLNSLGYKLLAGKRVQDAIVVFDLNAQTHPNSWNAYDSLGEAYLAAKDSEGALRAYNRSVELNPRNDNAKRIIERIKHAD